jgi:hypothetical protein
MMDTEQNSTEKRGKGLRAHWGLACVLGEVGGGPERPDFAGERRPKVGKKA